MKERDPLGIDIKDGRAEVRINKRLKETLKRNGITVQMIVDNFLKKNVIPRISKKVWK